MKGRIRLAAILAIFLALSFFFYLSVAENFVNSQQNSETDGNLSEQTETTTFDYTYQNLQQSVDSAENYANSSQESQRDENLSEQTTTTNSEQLVETSTTLPELSQINETANVAENETTETTGKPKILLKLSADKKRITRGEGFLLKAIINNEGSASAKNVKVIVDLPNGFSTDYSEKACDVIETNSSCELEFFIKSDLSSTLGENEVKVRMTYE